jgi:hypothetical protein
VRALATGVLLLLTLVAVPVGSAQAASGDVTTTLAEKYAPIVVVRGRPWARARTRSCALSRSRTTTPRSAAYSKSAVRWPKQALTGMAWQGYYLDTEGNTVGVHSPDPDAL